MLKRGNIRSSIFCVIIPSGSFGKIQLNTSNERGLQKQSLRPSPVSSFLFTFLFSPHSPKRTFVTLRRLTKMFEFRGR